MRVVVSGRRSPRLQPRDAAVNISCVAAGRIADIAFVILPHYPLNEGCRIGSLIRQLVP